MPSGLPFAIARRIDSEIEWIAADRKRRGALGVDGVEKGLDLAERALEFEWPLHPGVAEVGDFNEIERTNSGGLVVSGESWLSVRAPRADHVGRPCGE